MKISFSALLALLGAAVAIPAQNKAPTAQVKNGTISGVHSLAYNQDFFLGVPFAKPPVGDLRFRQAQSLNTTWKDVRNAKEYAKHCVGYGVCHASRIRLTKLIREARSNILSSIGRLSLPEHCPPCWIRKQEASGRLLDPWWYIYQWWRRRSTLQSLVHCRPVGGHW